MAIDTTLGQGQEQSADCEHRLGVVESLIDKALQVYPTTREELLDKVLRTRPNLPSLARGHIYRMTLGEVARYKAHNTSLNPSAVDAVLRRY